MGTRVWESERVRVLELCLRWIKYTLKYLGSGMVYPRYHPIQGLRW